MRLSRQISKITTSSPLSAVLPDLHTVVYTDSMINTGWLEISRISLRLPRLPRAFEGCRLVHISDIHMGTYRGLGMSEAILQEVVERVNAEAPDIVAITGDFVTSGSVAKVAPDLIGPLSQFKARDAVLAVLGNHDYYTNAAEVRKLLAQSGVTELDNTVYSLRRGSDQLHIAGIDDMYMEKGRLDAVLEQMPEDGGAILLAHEPDVADSSGPTKRFDLQLSGHSHGGQFNLPLIGVPFLPELGRKYPLGQYQVDDMILYTNRGVGASPPAVRVNCPPEIAVFSLHSC